MAKTPRPAKVIWRISTKREENVWVLTAALWPWSPPKKPSNYRTAKGKDRLALISKMMSTLAERFAPDEIRLLDEDLRSGHDKVRKGRWAMKHDRCVKCGTTEHPHVGKGLCYVCYNRPTGKKLAALFEKDPNTGRIIGRKPGLWSSISDRCLGCGTTEKPHEAHGRCRSCYATYVYRTNPKIRERMKRQSKINSIRNDYEEKRKAREQIDPEYAAKRKEQHRIASRRYAQKVAPTSGKWKVGQLVWMKVGERYVRGRIIDKKKGSAQVQFTDQSAWIAYGKLGGVIKSAEAAS